MRFSGIYGRSPSRLLERIARGDIVRPEPPHYSNRIHRDDCVGFLLHLLTLEERCLYLASDDLPALSHEVESWLAEELGVDETRGRWLPLMAANRRCRNAAPSAQSATACDTRTTARAMERRYSAMITSTSISAPLGKAAT